MFDVHSSIVTALSWAAALTDISLAMAVLKCTVSWYPVETWLPCPVASCIYQKPYLFCTSAKRA